MLGKQAAAGGCRGVQQAARKRGLLSARFCGPGFGVLPLNASPTARLGVSTTGAAARAEAPACDSTRHRLLITASNDTVCSRFEASLLLEMGLPTLSCETFLADRLLEAILLAASERCTEGLLWRSRCRRSDPARPAGSDRPRKAIADCVPPRSASPTCANLPCSATSRLSKAVACKHRARASCSKTHI